MAPRLSILVVVKCCPACTDNSPLKPKKSSSEPTSLFREIAHPSVWLLRKSDAPCGACFFSSLTRTYVPSTPLRADSGPIYVAPPEPGASVGRTLSSTGEGRALSADFDFHFLGQINQRQRRGPTSACTFEFDFDFEIRHN